MSASGGDNPAVAGAQSKSGPHSTLKEKSTAASCGSNPVSTAVTVERILLGLGGGVHQPQGIGGEIAGLVVRTTRTLAWSVQRGDDRQQRCDSGRLSRVDGRGLDHPIDSDIGDALAAVDQDVDRRVGAVGARAEVIAGANGFRQ